MKVRFQLYSASPPPILTHEVARYNCYKLLGYDVMLDSALCPHLLEVNSRPSVYEEQLDQAVNQPMVEEMFRSLYDL